ncbi:MAG: universal stress protein [Actinoplanes sp.]
MTEHGIDGSDRIVVGSHLYGTFAVLGSVSQHCVEHAPCPVVVVGSRRSSTRQTIGGRR